MSGFSRARHASCDLLATLLDAERLPYAQLRLARTPCMLASDFEVNTGDLASLFFLSGQREVMLSGALLTLITSTLVNAEPSVTRCASGSITSAALPRRHTAVPGRRQPVTSCISSSFCQRPLLHARTLLT